MTIGWALRAVVFVAADCVVARFFWETLPAPHGGQDVVVVLVFLGVLNGGILLAYLGPGLLAALPPRTRRGRLLVAWGFILALAIAVTALMAIVR